MLLVLACSPVGYRCCENTERYPTGVAYRCIVSHVVHTKKLAPMATRVREGVACVVFEGQIRSGQQNGCRPGGVGWRVVGAKQCDSSSDGTSTRERTLEEVESLVCQAPWDERFCVFRHIRRVSCTVIFSRSLRIATIQGRIWDASLFFASVGRMVPSCQWGRILLLHGRKNGCFSINCVEEHS